MGGLRTPYVARGIPVLGVLPHLRLAPLATLCRLVRAHPGVIQLKRGWYLVSEPDDIQHVLAGPVRYIKGAFSRRVSRAIVDPMRDTLGDGLLTSEGELWRTQRKLAQPAFHKARLHLLGPAMAAAAQALSERWGNLRASGAPIEVVAEMRRVTLDTIGRTVLSMPIDERGALCRALGEIAAITNEQFSSLLPQLHWLPTPRNRYWRRLRVTIDAEVHALLAERRREQRDHGDVLSAYMSARDRRTGDQMTDRLLRDELLTLLVAGHDSTAQALCWTLYLLARHPEAQRRTRDELSTQVAGASPTVDELPRLDYTHRVVLEAMRLYPPAWLLARSPEADDVVGGCPIAARSVVLVSPYATHRRPDLWEDPERFDPERFTAGRPRYAYFPFGGGGRQCIGNAFAIQEILIVIGTLIRRHAVALRHARPVEPLATISLRPRGPFELTVAAA